MDECVDAIKVLDSPPLEAVLKRAETELGALGLLNRLIAPLTQALGELWRTGEITSAHEHFGAAAIRLFLGNAAKPFGLLTHAPVLIVATPAGQIHAIQIESLTHLCFALDDLRKPLRLPSEATAAKSR